MPSFWMILANVAIGAFLAAWTNKKAIDWILKYVLPKRKGALARSVRDLIAHQLLTPEKMRDRLDDPGVADLFHRNLNEAFQSFLDSDLPSPDRLLASHAADLDRVAARLRDIALDGIRDRCGEPSFRDRVIRPWLAREWGEMARRSPRSLLPGPMADWSAAAAPWVEGLRTSASLRRGLQTALSGWLAGRIGAAATYGGLFPPAFRDALRDWVGEQAPLVCEQMAAALETPELQTAAADAVLSAVREQLNVQGAFGRIKNHLASWIGLEDDIRGFCVRLPATLRQTLRRPAQHGRIKDALRAAADSWLDQKPAPGLKTRESAERLAKIILDLVWQPDFFHDMGRRATEVLDGVLARSLLETAFRLGIDVSAPAWLDAAADHAQRVLSGETARNLLGGRFDEALSVWLKKPLGRLGRFLPSPSRDRLATLVSSEVRRLIQVRLGDFARDSGVYDIVAKSIEDYDNRKLGDMIRGLARDEFKKITLYGGLIGMVIGFGQSFIPGLVRWFAETRS